MSEKLNEVGSARGETEVETNVLDLLIVLVRHKKLIAGFVIAVGLIAMTISLLMTPIFTSTTRIMPPQQQGGSGMAAAMLGQLGGLAGAAGSFIGVKSPGDLYVGMLESRTIADSLINRFKLKERYKAETMDEARFELHKITNVDSGKKDGLISISVDDKDPRFAAELANAYVDELMKLNETLAVSDASMRRLFFERQLKSAKDQLADAEVALRQTQEKTGMIHTDGQVQAIIGSIAHLEAAIAAKEVQIKAMRTFAAAQNPELMRAEEELRGLQAQRDKLEKSRPGKEEGDFMVPLGELPAVGVEYVRRLRDVKYNEALFEMLAKQYELAKIDEAHDSSSIQILDKAIPAEKRSKPKRTLLTLAGIILGAVLGVISAFGIETYRRSRLDPRNNSRWQELMRA